MPPFPRRMPVPRQIAGRHGIAALIERLRHVGVPPRMFTKPVHDRQNGFRLVDGPVVSSKM
ncbi:hypothetical protein [Tellurirhabdus rosea]|uniref:hypothetical protein n=1 Tax=Tellurirhabdus rosea TaxID=2674997 RepID=UPI0022523C32|nr:hypothetical protein [Tellurirhabdus rosea]